MNVTEDSHAQVILIGLVAGGLVGVISWRSRRTFVRLILGMLAVCLLVPSAVLFVGKNPWLVDARFRTFKMAYWYIRIGMSRDEVLREIRDLYPADGRQEAPVIVEDTASTLRIQMNTGDPPEHIRDFITLTMQDGRVMGKNQSSE